MIISVGKKVTLSDNIRHQRAADTPTSNIARMSKKLTTAANSNKEPKIIEMAIRTFSEKPIFTGFTCFFD